MDRWTRLDKAFSLEYPDRPPIIGGWLAAPNHVQTLTGCSDDDYWSDPAAWGIAAERVLGSDGTIDVIVPASRGEFRIIDQSTLDRRAAYTVERVLETIAALPDLDEIKDGFDEERAYADLRAQHLARQVQCGEVIWCPADWQIIPKGLWYEQFGYESALMTLALYPDDYRKLITTSAERARQRSILRARLMREGIQPRAIMTGEDICSQQGPMVSPAYLRAEYWHLVEYALEPLVEIGAKIVWHCDGNYRPLLDDVLACGVAGLQGFQRECGMDLEWIRNLRTRQGDPLLVFGDMSVTQTLCYGTPEDVITAVQHTMDLARDHVGLVLFTSNDITPDIPLENVLTFWKTAQSIRW